MHDEPALTTISAGDAMLLDLLKAGTADAETAVRLGLSVGQVRLRIERLMALAQVTERAALRAWDPSLPPTFQGPTATPPAEQPIHVTGRPGHIRLPAVVSAAAVLALVAALAGWLLWDDGDGASPATVGALPPAPLASGAPLPGPRGTVARPVTVTVEPAIPLPAGLVVYLLTGCDRCDRPPEAIERVYRDGSGAVRSDVLFRAPAGGYILSAWAAGDASDFVVAVCEGGDCGGGISGPGDGVPRTSLHRSVDGGLSWAVADSFEGRGEVLGARPGGEILVRLRSFESAERFVLRPSGEPLTPPPNALPGRGPRFAGAAGDVVWTTSGTSIISGVFGEPMVPALTPEMWGLSRAATRVGRAEPWAFSWSPATNSPGQPDTETRIAEVDASGQPFTVVNHAGTPLLLGPWVDTHTLIASVEHTAHPGVLPGDPAPAVSQIPALLDLEEATLTPIREPFALPPYEGGRSEILAARLGIFLRITGDRCVTVLTLPSIGGRPLDCLAPGMIATVTEANVINTVYWARVRTPAGDLGWLPARVDGVELLAR